MWNTMVKAFTLKELTDICSNCVICEQHRDVIYKHASWEPHLKEEVGISLLSQMTLVRSRYFIYDQTHLFMKHFANIIVEHNAKLIL